MSENILIDAGVFVQAYDGADREKQQTAVTLLDTLVSSQKGIVSTGILVDFFKAVTERENNPLTLAEATSRVENFCQIWPVVQVNEMILLEALRGVVTHRFSIPRSLLWATARLNQASLVFSTNFTHDLVVEGVRFFNPFSTP